MTNIFKDLVNPRRSDTTIIVERNFDSVTQLYDARDSGSLSIGGIYSISWRNDDYAPDGQIVTKWNGAYFYPNPLTQAEMPLSLFEEKDWNLFDDQSHTTTTFNSDGTITLTKPNGASGGTAILYLNERYKNSYRYMGSNIRIQNADQNTSNDRMGLGLCISPTVSTYYSISGIKGLSDVGAILRYGSFSEQLTAARSWTSDESFFIYQDFNQATTGTTGFFTGVTVSGSTSSERIFRESKSSNQNNVDSPVSEYASTPSFVIQHGDALGSGINTILTARTLLLSKWDGDRERRNYYFQPSLGTWTPEEVSTTVWYDPSDYKNRTLDSLTEYNSLSDKSGNGNNAIYTNSTSNMTVGWRNKLTTIKMNSGDSRFSIPSSSFDLSPGRTYAMFFTMDPLAADTIYMIVTSDSSEYFGCAQAGNTANVTESGLDSTPEYWVNGAVMPSPQDRDQIQSSLANGGVGLIKNIDVSSGFGDWSLFWYTTASTTFRYGGEYGEIIIIDENNLTTEIQQKIEGYLAWKWGYQRSLPNTHPYLTAPPQS